MMKTTHVMFLGSLFLLALSTAHANESLRCGSHIVEIGDDRDTVLEYCGQPTAEKGWSWTYDRGPEELTVVIHFHADGTVNRIEEGSYE